jgi:hypothetical protein
LPAPARSLWSEAQLRDRLMAFNDAYCKSFAELRAVLIKARIRAVREFCHAAAQTSVERQAEIAATKAEPPEGQTRRRSVQSTTTTGYARSRPISKLHG